MAPLRQALRALLAGAAVSRPPALRRARTDDALLACDLPCCASPEETERLVRRMREAGWTVREEAGWLLLDHPLTLEAAAIPGPGEAAACRSLLQRHPELQPDPVCLRRLAKALETPDPGPALRETHGCLAALLRTGKSGA